MDRVRIYSTIRGIIELCVGMSRKDHSAQLLGYTIIIPWTHYNFLASRLDDCPSVIPPFAAICQRIPVALLEWSL